MLHGLVWRRILSIPWISVIGGMCYSIYLIHMPILELGANLTSKVGAGLPYSDLSDDTILFVVARRACCPSCLLYP